MPCETCPDGDDERSGLHAISICSPLVLHTYLLICGVVRAAEVAEILGTTTTAVKSALQRARGRLEEVAPAADQVAEPAEPEARALLDQYIRAFETSDAAAHSRKNYAGYIDLAVAPIEDFYRFYGLSS